MEIIQNTPHLWLIAGVILIVLEFLAVPGIGFLFAGFGALTIGILTESGVVHDQNVAWVIFLAATVLWAAFLWKPFTNIRINKNTKPFSDMVGHHAILLTDLAPGQTGQAKWSGTIMSAKLEKASTITLLKNSEVTIIEVKGNVLTVR